MLFTATICTNNYPRFTERALVEACGLIPSFVMNIGQDQDIVEGLTEQYGFGTLIPMVGKIEGSICKSPYEEGSDLYPYMLLTTETADLYIYPYGIVSIVYKDSRDTFITRMD